MASNRPHDEGFSLGLNRPFPYRVAPQHSLSLPGTALLISLLHPIPELTILQNEDFSGVRTMVEMGKCLVQNKSFLATSNKKVRVVGVYRELRQKKKDNIDCRCGKL